MMKLQKLLFPLILISLISLQACGKSPVEEIASAEAALQAAREAEAPARVPTDYQKAEESMVETYQYNDNRDYKEAKDQAIETKTLADRARELALEREEEAGADRADETAGADGYDDQPAVESETIGSGSLDAGQRLAALNAIYFDFDDYTVNQSQMDQLKVAAQWLKANPTAVIQLEGHTDERGASDYNMTLGSKRAKSVKEVLISLGIDADRIDTRSYGEELPANPAHDETAWQQNRRVEFVVNP